jgi:hypothetical protein
MIIRQTRPTINYDCTGRTAATRRAWKVAEACDEILYRMRFTNRHDE